MARPVKTLVRRVRRTLGRLIAAFLLGSSAVARRIPAHVALAAADAFGLLLYVLNGRGRQAGHQNLKAVYGDALSPRERRRILRGSYKTLMRNGWSLLHLQPLTPKSYARWVSVSPEAMAWLQHLSTTFDKGVMVSGHFGNWELLLGTRLAFPNSAKITSLFEQTPVPELDVALDSLRGRGGGKGVVRKGGALGLKAALDRGESVGMLVDRNVRQEHGGVWVPFLGLEARTSPLPVVLARRFGVPMGMLLCVPDGKRHWRLWMSPDLMEPPTDDEDADVRKILAKINDVLSQKIREHPEAWLWMIKRWKGRPTEALGRYPAYSYWDPDVRR